MILIPVLQLLGLSLLSIMLALRVAHGIREARRQYATHGEFSLRGMTFRGPSGRYVHLLNMALHAFSCLASLAFPFMAAHTLVRLLEFQYQVGASITWLGALGLGAT